MTRQEIIDALTDLASALDDIKETATDKEFAVAAQSDMKDLHRAFRSIKRYSS